MYIAVKYLVQSHGSPAQKAVIQEETMTNKKAAPGGGL
jgi:hypothetical protein